MFEKETQIEERLSALAKRLYRKPIQECTDAQLYNCVLMLTKEALADRKANEGKKKVYYISMEFLIGKLLSNNLINLGIYDQMESVLAKNGKSLSAIEDAEPEPSLGNGGLGRLAACFLDSIATLGLPGDGIGLNYHFGLFKQVFKDHLQMAEKNSWIEKRSWLNETGTTFEVVFGDKKVTSVLYDLDVAGYESGLGKLHLFDVKGLDEKLVKKGINFDKTATDRNLTLFLYPDDSDEAGNLLRVYQEYFLVSNAAQLIVKELKDAGRDLHKMDQYAAVQINDTHPSMVIPELIRILTWDEEFTMEDAIKVVSKTCAYTNHTILAEALEKWPLSYIEQVVPALVPIIKELNARVKKKYKNPKVWIIDDSKRVHMAHMDIHYGYSVNGVAAIHTDILKETELHDFYELYPQKFNNKTNGITFRRWLLSCNRELTALLDETIGTGYKKNADELEKLLAFQEDEKVLSAIEAIKQGKKEHLVQVIREKEGVELDPNSIFDIQVKRLHEYKRQQMNALYIIHKYLEIKAGKKPVRPLTFLFGAKAAPAYIIARDIIHLLLVMSDLINNDPEVSPYMKLVMVENYNVSYAEKLIPACDISEQISLASKEASGTGNMKYMLNGAITIGTMDGANVEMVEEVGEENIVIFGMSADEVIAHEKARDYDPMQIFNNDPEIRQVLMQLINGFYSKNDTELFRDLYNSLLNTKCTQYADTYFTLADFRSYAAAQEKISQMYADEKGWAKKAILNTAHAGKFSSDRTIQQYVDEIWHLDKMTVKVED